jgi:hypothetical protein
MLHYKGKLLNFDLVLFALAEDEAECANIFIFLKQNRHHIDDTAVLGVLDFLDDNNNDYDLLSQTLLNIERTDFSKKPKPIQRKRYFPYAASLIIFLGVGVFYYYFSQTSKPYVFVPDEFGLDNMLSDHASTSHWDDFVASFIIEDYANAVRVIDSMPEGVALDSIAYFKGVSAFKLGDYKLAAENFIQLQHHKHSLFFQDGEYFLALSLLKAKKLKNAHSVLKSIVDQENHPFRDESIYLLDNFY